MQLLRQRSATVLSGVKSPGGAASPQPSRHVMAHTCAKRHPVSASHRWSPAGASGYCRTVYPDASMISSQLVPHRSSTASVTPSAAAASCATCGSISATDFSTYTHGTDTHNDM